MGNRSYLSLRNNDGTATLLADANNVVPPFWLSMLPPGPVAWQGNAFAHRDTAIVDAVVGGDGPTQASVDRSTALARLAAFRAVWRAALPEQGVRAFDLWVTFVTQFDVAGFIIDVTEFTWFFDQEQDGIDKIQAYLDALEQSLSLTDTPERIRQLLKPLLDQCGWLDADWDDPDELYLLLGDAPLHDMPWIPPDESDE